MVVVRFRLLRAALCAAPENQRQFTDIAYTALRDLQPRATTLGSGVRAQLDLSEHKLTAVAAHAGRADRQLGVTGVMLRCCTILVNCACRLPDAGGGSAAVSASPETGGGGAVVMATAIKSV
jgi:hypothetical protein